MLMTVQSVAARLTVTVPTVWRYARTNPEFPRPVKLSPGCTRWRAEDIEAWVASK